MSLKHIVSVFYDDGKLDIEVEADNKEAAIERVLDVAHSTGGWIAKEENSSLTFIKLEKVNKIVSIDVAAQEKENQEMWADTTAFFNEMNR